MIEFQHRSDALRRLLGAGFGLPTRRDERGAAGARSAAAQSDDDEQETAAQLLPAHYRTMD